MPMAPQGAEASNFRAKLSRGTNLYFLFLLDNIRLSVKLLTSARQEPPMNKAAQALGRLAKGVPKTFTKAERERRRLRLAAVRAKRWPAKAESKP
jgi:hypothetical protein